MFRKYRVDEDNDKLLYIRMTLKCSEKDKDFDFLDTKKTKNI